MNWKINELYIYLISSKTLSKAKFNIEQDMKVIPV